MGRIQGTLDIVIIGASDLAEHLAVNRGRVLEVAALHGRDPLAADVVVISGLKGHQRTLSTRSCVNSHGFLSCHQGRQECVGTNLLSSCRASRPRPAVRRAPPSNTLSPTITTAPTTKPKRNNVAVDPVT